MRLTFSSRILLCRTRQIELLPISLIRIDHSKLDVLLVEVGVEESVPPSIPLAEQLAAADLVLAARSQQDLLA